MTHLRLLYKKLWSSLVNSVATAPASYVPRQNITLSDSTMAQPTRPNLTPQQIALAESFMKSKFGDWDGVSRESVNKLVVGESHCLPSLYLY